MLILKCVSQFMRHHRLLPFQIQPVRQMEFLGLRIVVAGHLLGQELDDKRAILKVGRRQAKLP